MNITEIKKNPLLHREEITASLEKEVTPSKQEAIKMISEQLKKPEELIVIDGINNKFGSNKFTIKAKVYDRLESKNKTETVPRKFRRKKEKEAAEAAGKK